MADNSLLEKVLGLQEKYEALQAQLSDPEVISDMKKFVQLNKEYKELTPIIEAGNEFKRILENYEMAKEILATEKDEDLREMAKEEIAEIEPTLPEWEEKIKLLLIPADPQDSKNAILEIRGGSGGDEAAIFAGDLFRMYSKFIETKGWRMEVTSQAEGAAGGFKEIVCKVTGDGVYGVLKYESGVHRVQRVPATESQGRLQTSTATVAVLPEAEETEIEIKPGDVRIDVMRAGGPGGQCVNTTDSAVRLTHIPTGIVVIQQDEKSQIKNKEKAFRVLRARLFDLEESKKQAERAAARSSMVGSGARSEKIRTYNYPQDRVTDHRINYSQHNLPAFMMGEMDGMLDALNVYAKEEQLKADITTLGND